MQRLQLWIGWAGTWKATTRLRQKPKTDNSVRNIDGVLSSPPATNSKSLLIKLILTILLTLALAGVIALYLNREDTIDVSNVEQVKIAINKHYSLPTDEQPALATVTDITKLSSSFKKSTKNGDKILIYQNNRKAIVYRPSIDRVVDVQPVNIDAPPKPKQ